jgi:uncharacterized protein (DUF983 family)
VSSGLKGRCPECGEGKIFTGLLKIGPGCEACGSKFVDDDAGDGPAVFVIFIVGIFIIPMALAFHFLAKAPMWLTMMIWVPIIIMVCLYLLRVMRAVMFNLTWVNKNNKTRNMEPSGRQVPPK